MTSQPIVSHLTRIHVFADAESMDCRVQGVAAAEVELMVQPDDLVGFLRPTAD